MDVLQECTTQIYLLTNWLCKGRTYRRLGNNKVHKHNAHNCHNILYSTVIATSRKDSKENHLENFGSLLLVFPDDHSYRLNDTAAVPLTCNTSLTQGSTRDEHRTGPVRAAWARPVRAASLDPTWRMDRGTARARSGRYVVASTFDKCYNIKLVCTISVSWLATLNRLNSTLLFLRASAMLKHVIDIGWTSVCLSVCPSVRPSVRHTLVLYQNGWIYCHAFFTTS